MSLLAIFRPAPQRPPGRHTAEWAQLQQDRADLRRAVRDLEHRCDGLEWERDAALDEAEDLKQRHAREVAGLREAMQTVGAECRGVAAERDEARAERDRLTEEVKDLRHLLASTDGDPGMPGHQAPADDPRSCFSQPDPAPAGNGPRIVADSPVAPAASEAADVNAETLAVDVRGLRAGRVTVPAAWTVAAVPPSPLLDLAPTLAVPLAEALAVRPVEASTTAGERARASVADALKPDLADAHS